MGKHDSTTNARGRQGKRGNEKEKRLGGDGERLGRLHVAQNLVRAIAAAPAARAHAQLDGKLVEGAAALPRAVAHGFFGDRVADADVQGALSSLRSIVIYKANNNQYDSVY